MEIITVKNSRYDGLKVYQHDTEFPDRVARLALQMLADKGLIMAASDGEDSAGRAKVMPAPAREIVDKAFDVAEAFYEVAAQRGHLIAVPEMADQTD